TIGAPPLQRLPAIRQHVRNLRRHFNSSHRAPGTLRVPPPPSSPYRAAACSPSASSLASLRRRPVPFSAPLRLCLPKACAPGRLSFSTTPCMTLLEAKAAGTSELPQSPSCHSCVNTRFADESKSSLTSATPSPKAI